MTETAVDKLFKQDPFSLTICQQCGDIVYLFEIQDFMCRECWEQYAIDYDRREN